MATDAQTLLASSNCYNNFSAQFGLLKLGLLRQIALALNPMADTTPQTLLANSVCYNCYGPGAWPLLELALLQTIANNGGGGGGSGTGTLTGNGSPVGVVTPAAIGQLYTDPGTPALWESTGLTNTSWIQLILAMILCLLMPMASFGAGATVSTTNGFSIGQALKNPVATNLTVVGGMGPQSDVSHATNADSATVAGSTSTAAFAFTARNADGTGTIPLANDTRGMTNTGIVEFDNPASSYTGTLFGQATGLVIPGNGTISYVVGYAADGTSLVTNTGYAAGMLTSNLLAVAPAVGQALIFTNGHFEAGSPSVTSINVTNPALIVPSMTVTNSNNAGSPIGFVASNTASGGFIFSDLKLYSSGKLTADIIGGTNDTSAALAVGLANGLTLGTGISNQDIGMRVGYAALTGGNAPGPNFLLKGSNGRFIFGGNLTASALDSQDSEISVKRVLDNASILDSIYAHAYADNSYFSRTGYAAYSSFDSRTTFIGTNKMWHYAGFQSLPTLTNGFSGRLDKLIGFLSTPNIFDGVISNYYGFQALDLNTNGGTGGTVSNSYGFYTAPLLVARTNWGVYVESNNSYFNGSVLVKNIVVTGTSNAAPPNVTVGTTVPDAWLTVTNNGVAGRVPWWNLTH